jgi:hypothetical protein
MKASILFLTALILSLQAHADIIVSLEPDSQSIGVGSPVSMDLVVSGLGDHASPSLGGFDFTLSYNLAVLSAASLSFGNYLNLGILGSLQNSDLSTPGIIHLDEISFESASALQANQPSSFTLATLGFSGAGGGISAVNVTSGSLSDETGQVSLQFLTKAGQVEVSGAAASIPDTGSSGCLLALGLVSLFVVRQKAFHCAMRQ